jgi:hypothetical protein
MKKKLLAFLAILFSFALAYGQDNLVINFVDHSNVAVAFSNIQKITFNNDNLLLKTTSGTENSYLLDNIAFITFLNETGIKQFNETVDVNIFINSFGEIAVETPHQLYKLTVFDLAGREVAITTQSKLNVNFLNTGIYILQVITDKGLVSKKFIKNR